MSFGRVSKGGAGRRQGEIILTDSAAEQQGACTWHFTDRTCPAEPVSFEVFIIYILSSQSRGKKQDIRKTRTRRDCNSKCCAIHLMLHTHCAEDRPTRSSTYPRTSCHIYRAQALFGQRPGTCARSKNITSKEPNS